MLVNKDLESKIQDNLQLDQDCCPKTKVESVIAMIIVFIYRIFYIHIFKCGFT